MEKQTPNYYLLPDGRDLWEIFTPEERKVIGRFNTIKYAFRAGNKDGEDEAKDLRKARRYIDLRLADIEKGNDNKREGKVKAYEVIVTYTDGSTDNLTLCGLDGYDAECQASIWRDKYRTIKDIGTARELSPAEVAARKRSM